MIQMEGRFLREDSQFKTIYRTHPVNIKPYPGRVYRSWEDCFFQEFYQVITTEELMEELTEKQQEIVNWIVTNAGDREFTSPELAQANRYGHFKYEGKVSHADGLERAVGG